ncbi:MAG: hypothetical protein UT87_C0010G0011 [Candidatus Levybacteria bacterium GW2011_GWC1_40_19]|nr:MAG: hypothetical protein UT87_C0010G0011 [Candidatus Levybacteria bacterium GW2011_GWC1_40_19]KKR73168.1 MAG: hypothetical protein UU15_C0017G0007 [Candidatus Levybacteria bacterium GW2011_GWC2_40_7]KKR94061.1 MAG: hypothetical protein UU45_C0017G0010 [Candidatus Levybacteria bacterium GW2011_GWA2_41_15]KKS01182.1 MAG: hypothetical protein UU52_C0017G0010 [Candidatus Levybacteria bacterium GW2011_GWB1_41_21]
MLSPSTALRAIAMNKEDGLERITMVSKVEP